MGMPVTEPLLEISLYYRTVTVQSTYQRLSGCTVFWYYSTVGYFNFFRQCPATVAARRIGFVISYCRVVGRLGRRCFKT
jgi:hypothetical protein